MSYEHIRPITLPIQQLHMQRYFPGFSCCCQKDHARWYGTMCPQRASPHYHVEVQYRIGAQPKVYVREPAITAAPHLYEDGSLCLYWPQQWVWRADRLIAHTIVPWAALWLLYYELWQDTGLWFGPSHHPPADRRKE